MKKKNDEREKIIAKTAEEIYDWMNINGYFDCYCKAREEGKFNEYCGCCQLKEYWKKRWKIGPDKEFEKDYVSRAKRRENFKKKWGV